jgi:hypothetical protein
MVSFLTSPTFTTGVEVYLALMLYSALVQNLPNPSTYGGVWYKAIYGFLSVLASDFKSFATSLPSSTANPQLSGIIQSASATITTTESTSVAGETK